MNGKIDKTGKDALKMLASRFSQYDEEEVRQDDFEWGSAEGRIQAGNELTELIDSMEVIEEPEIIHDYIFCSECGYMAGKVGDEYSCSQCNWVGPAEAEAQDESP